MSQSAIYNAIIDNLVHPGIILSEREKTEVADKIFRAVMSAKEGKPQPMPDFIKSYVAEKGTIAEEHPHYTMDGR